MANVFILGILVDHDDDELAAARLLLALEVRERCRKMDRAGDFQLTARDLKVTLQS